MSRRTWRSAPRVPALVDAGAVRFPEEPLQRLAFAGAWRSRGFAHALGHGLRRAPAAAQREVLRRADRALSTSDAFLAACEAGGLADAPTLVEARLSLEPIPQVESWAELAVADALMAGAGSAALGGIVDAALPELAAAARSFPVEAGFGEDVLDGLCEDTENRACIQLLVDRWMPVAIQSFGRPRTSGDARARDAAVKTAASEELLERWLRDVEPRLRACGLEVPDALMMGLDLPQGWAPTRPQLHTTRRT